MAIELLNPEGKNSIDNPYLVSNYDELKEVCEKTSYNGNIESTDTWDSILHVRLTEDIDWNNEERDWEVITMGHAVKRVGATGTNYATINLDLDQHCIKNVYLKTNKDLFKLYQSNTNTVIRNGSILNIFSDNSYPVFNGNGSAPKTLQGDMNAMLINVSISLNSSSMCYAPIFGWGMNKCSLFFKTSTPHIPLQYAIVGVFNNKNIPIVDSHIHLEIDNYSNAISLPLFYCNYNAGTVPNLISGSKIDGYVRTTDNSTLAKDCFLLKNDYSINNTVIDFEIKWSSEGYSLLGKGGTGIVNISKVQRGNLPMTEEGKILWSNMLAVNQEHMNDAEWLTQHGFSVENGE